METGKNVYRFCVTETIKKWVEVEASTVEEAEQIALEEDMDKNPDSYEREATLLSCVLSAQNCLPMVECNYPLEVNGWNYTLDSESMSYWKDYEDGHSEAIALCWLDTVEGDEGYNPEGDAYTLIWAQNYGNESAVESLYYSNMTFGGVMRRKEAEQKLIEYMETH